MKYKLMIVVLIVFILGMFSSCLGTTSPTSNEIPTVTSDSPTVTSDSPNTRSSLSGIWKYADDDFKMTFFFEDSNFEITTIEKTYIQKSSGREYNGDQIITYSGTYLQTDSEIILTLSSVTASDGGYVETISLTPAPATLSDGETTIMMTPEEVNEFIEHQFYFKNMPYSIVKGYSSPVLRVKISDRPFELIQL